MCDKIIKIDTKGERPWKIKRRNLGYSISKKKEKESAKIKFSLNPD